MSAAELTCLMAVLLPSAALVMVVMLMPASLITSVSFFDPVMPCSIALSHPGSPWKVPTSIFCSWLTSASWIALAPLAAADCTSCTACLVFCAAVMKPVSAVVAMPRAMPHGPPISEMSPSATLWNPLDRSVAESSAVPNDSNCSCAL